MRVKSDSLTAILAALAAALAGCANHPPHASPSTFDPGSASAGGRNVRAEPGDLVFMRLAHGPPYSAGFVSARRVVGGPVRAP